MPKLLSPEEVRSLAQDLRSLQGAVVQKVYAPGPARAYLELRIPGETVVLLLCAEAGTARVTVVAERGPSPQTPPAWQHVLRRELTGAALHDVTALAGGLGLALRFAKQGRGLDFVLELSPAPRLVLALDADRVLALTRVEGSPLRVGGAYAVDREPQGGAPATPGLQVARALEARFAGQELEDARRAVQHPLKTKLKRLRRTIEKVRADAARADGAQALKEEGELLAQNLHRVKRGDTSVEVDEYLTDGSIQKRTVALDPARSPKDEVARRFHQYKRLLRGAGVAAQRVLVLEAEATALEAQLEQAAQADRGELPTPAQATARAAAPQPRARAFFEYRGHAGRKILVGRGAARNDELTFHVARPFDLWLHVRGVPGAHVVVPLEKNEAVPPELLIDAAHLAVHHSEVKGETRAEVSYVLAKYVKKPKGGAPGAVLYTREKTLLVRLEPQRLAQLLTQRIEAD